MNECLHRAVLQNVLVGLHDMIPEEITWKKTQQTGHLGLLPTNNSHSGPMIILTRVIEIPGEGWKICIQVQIID